MILVFFWKSSFNRDTTGMQLPLAMTSQPISVPHRPPASLCTLPGSLCSSCRILSSTSREPDSVAFNEDSSYAVAGGLKITALKNYIILFFFFKVKVLIVQSCSTLCDPQDCSLLCSSVRGILQTKILEWVAIPFSRGSSQPRDWTQVSHIVRRLYRLSHLQVFFFLKQDE